MPEEAVKDPSGMVASIRFDMGKFAEVIALADAGAFIVTSSS